jgi:hypothetical protein
MNTKLVAFAYAGITAFSLSVLADIVNFDEFRRLRVTCCVGSSVAGPLVYSDVIIADGAESGAGKNGGGRSNQQYSGNNLFGTNTSLIMLSFNPSAIAVQFDVNTGTNASNFSVD